MVGLRGAPGRVDPGEGHLTMAAGDLSSDDQFLAAIIARPDDLPRLVYADWLEERGDPRAEFIRVQVDLANRPWVPGLSPASYDRQREIEALRRRELELLGGGPSLPVNGIRYATNEDAWVIAALGGWAYITPAGTVADNDWTFRRGFVEEVACPWADFARHAAAIRAATPLRRVRLTTWIDRPIPSAFWEADNPVLAWLAVEYPGVEFELPWPRWQNYASQHTNIGRAELIRQWRDAAASLEHVRPGDDRFAMPPLVEPPFLVGPS